MAIIVETESFGRRVTIDEIARRLAEIDIDHAIQIVTTLASRQRWLPHLDEVRSKVNPIQLSFLAKAVVLYCCRDGRQMNLTDGPENDLRWLLTAVNSMNWYSEAELAANHHATVLSSLMRQAYLSNAISEDLATAVSRAYAMFHEILPDVNRGRVDSDAVMQEIAGVTCGDLWRICSAIYAFYLIECAKPGGPWLFGPESFVDSPRRDELAAGMRLMLSHVARTPEELRSLYASGKYHDPCLPIEYWLSEFNILRDFPVVALKGLYCCPSPALVLLRGAVSFFFDLSTHYAKIEAKNNPRNPNPNDNVMTHVLGEVFQEYVGVHLRSSYSIATYLRPEFQYKVGKNRLASPDWLLLRLPNRPLLFECKARRPALVVQTRCNEADWKKEAAGVLARALGQLVTFLKNAEAGLVSDMVLTGDWQVTYVLVTYDEFPFHATPDVRDEVDLAAERVEPEWARFRNHVLFVPLSIQELEIAVQIESEAGILLEDQFEAYAHYRRHARRVANIGGRTVIAQHFKDHVLERLRGSVQLDPLGKLCGEYWHRFTEEMYSSYYGESMADNERRRRNQWIQEAAYLRWIEAGRPHGHDLEHWVKSEEEYAKQE